MCQSQCRGIPAHGEVGTGRAMEQEHRFMGAFGVPGGYLNWHQRHVHAAAELGEVGLAHGAVAI